MVDLNEINEHIENLEQVLRKRGHKTESRGTFVTGVGGPTFDEPDFSAAIEDITTNGLGKTSLDDGNQRCLLGSIMGETKTFNIRTLIRIISQLPSEPGDFDLINRLTFRPMDFENITQAIDRIAAFNDDDHTTAEDVILILKKLEEKNVH